MEWIVRTRKRDNQTRTKPINLGQDSVSRNQGLQEALTNSTNWYFQQLNTQLGKAQLSKEFSAIHYGNGNLLGSVNDYWLESSLKIAAVEQVQLIKKLINYELNFSTQHVQFMKEVLKLETGASYTLYGKTGAGKKQNKKNAAGLSDWLKQVTILIILRVICKVKIFPVRQRSVKPCEF